MGEAALALFSRDRAGMGRKLLLCGRGIHSGEDPYNFCSLSGGDVLGHVDDGIHGNFWIGLYQAADLLENIVPADVFDVLFYHRADAIFLCQLLFQPLHQVLIIVPDVSLQTRKSWSNTRGQAQTLNCLVSQKHCSQFSFCGWMWRGQVSGGELPSSVCLPFTFRCSHGSLSSEALASTVLQQ